MAKLIILGNGIAGHSVLGEVLKQPAQYDITVVYDEDPRTYLRTQITSYALGQVPEEKFFMTDPDYYESKGVRAIQAKATGLDPEGKTVSLSTGETLAYDKLVIATGAFNFVPPVAAEGHSELTSLDSDTIHNQDGVYTMRQLEDARLFADKVRKAKKAIIVGGGLLGLEAAGALKDHGLEVTVVEFAHRLLPRQLDAATSAHFQKKAEDYGIGFITGNSVAKVLFAADVVKGVELVTGECLDADLVLFSIGIRSQIAPFTGCLATNRGILINEFGETNYPDIYACGDCAEQNGMVYGTWSFAMASGRSVGKNLVGQCDPMKPYVLFTLFNSLDTKVFSAGMINFDDPDLEVYESGNPDDKYVKLLFRDQALVGGILMGDTAKGPQISTAINKHLPKEEAIANFGMN